MTAIETAGYTGKVGIALDVAAGEFYADGKYDLDFSLPADSRDPAHVMTGEALADLYISLVEKYPIVSIEDPFDQDDWESVSRSCLVCHVLVLARPARVPAAAARQAASSGVVSGSGSAGGRGGGTGPHKSMRCCS